MALPGVYPVRVRQGATWTKEFQLLDDNGAAIDLSSYSTVRCQVRTSYANQGGSLVCSGTIAYTDAVNGKFTLTFPAATTAAIGTAGSEAGSTSLGPYVYDVELATAGGVVLPAVTGQWTMDFEVTTS